MVNCSRKRLKVFLAIISLLLMFALFLLPVPGGAVPETDLFSAEEKIQIFWDSQFSRGSFAGNGGVSIRYAKRELPVEKGALVVVSGRTEYMSKYAELFYDLQDIGYSFYILDHRGQGGSGRLLADPHKGYVENFTDYSDDLNQFIDTVVNHTPHGRLYVLSHSMGGAVAALSDPKLKVSGQIFCSPMFQINASPLPASVASWLASSVTRMGGGAWYVFGGGPYNPAKKFQGNDLTHSEERFEYNKRLIVQKPYNALGSPTFKWLAESFAADKTIMIDVAVMPYPVLVIRSGDDSVVGLEAQDSFCAKLADCSLHEISGARHELLMEKDQYRDQVLELIKNFITYDD